MATALLGTEHYIYRKDGKLYVYQVGGGEPVVFLHAVGGSGWSWRKVVDQVARHFACYVVDMPGYDHSDIPPRQYSMEDYADAILDVLDGIGLEKTNIVSTRTGAIVTTILAARHPERVKRLVIDGLPYWDKERGQIVWERFFKPQFTDTTSYHLPVAPISTWEEDKAKNPRLEREEWEKSDSIRRRSRLWSRLTQEKNSGFDVTSVGPDVKAPTLLIYGDGDPLRRGQARASEDIKGSIVEVIPDCPTLSPANQHHPDKVAERAIEFLTAS